LDEVPEYCGVVYDTRLVLCLHLWKRTSSRSEVSTSITACLVSVMRGDRIATAVQISAGTSRANQKRPAFLRISEHPTIAYKFGIHLSHLWPSA